MTLSSNDYASRAAHKLLGFIKQTGFSFKDKIVADIGSSHGGFVHVIAASGAKTIYAVDVGKGLLDWKLRNLDNIQVMEGVNARELKSTDFPVIPHIATIDVSFISVRKILPVIFEIATESVIVLIKPQFEADYAEVSKASGVITDPEIHRRVIEEIKEDIEDSRWEFIASYQSAVKGKKGNQEYFLYYDRIHTLGS